MQITIQDDTIFHLLSSFFEQASRADLPSSFNMGDHRIKKRSLCDYSTTSSFNVGYHKMLIRVVLDAILKGLFCNLKAIKRNFIMNCWVVD